MLNCAFLSVLSPTSFSIDNTSGDEFGKYLCGGMLKKVKLPVNVKFVSNCISFSPSVFMCLMMCGFVWTAVFEQRLINFDSHRRFTIETHTAIL